MPIHKHIRRRNSPDHLEEPIVQQLDSDDSKQKSSTPHEPAISSSSGSSDTSPLDSLFLLADQALHEKEVEDSNNQRPLKQLNSPEKKSRIKASKSRRPSPKGSRKLLASHSEISSQRRFRRSSRGSRSAIPIDPANVSTKDKETGDFVERSETADAGAVSFDSSADDLQPKVTRSRQDDDSLVPKTVTITKDQEKRLVSSSSEGADDTAEFVLSSRDSSERSTCEADLLSVSGAQKCAVKRAPGFSARTKETPATEALASKSVRIEDDVDGEGIVEADDTARESSLPEETCLAISTSQPHAFNRSAFATGTAVKKLCEKRGCWITGEVADCEKATNAICRVQFEVDESVDLAFDDSIHIRSTQKDLDLLEKMVKLARVCSGTRVSIHWPEDNIFYPATVLQERLQNRKAFFIQYDDGESEWINLWFHQFQVLEDSPSRKKSKIIAKETWDKVDDAARVRKRKRATNPKELENLKTKNLERIETAGGSDIAAPREVQKPFDSKAKKEDTEDEKVDSVSAVDTRGMQQEKRKDDAQSSHNGTTVLKRKRGRPKNTVSSQPSNSKAKDKDENSNLALVDEYSEKGSQNKLNTEVQPARMPISEDASSGEAVSKTRRGRPRKSDAGVSGQPISNNFENKTIDKDDLESDIVSSGEVATITKRGRPRKLDNGARGQHIPSNVKITPLDEDDVESDDIEPRNRLDTKRRVEGQKTVGLSKNSDLCDTDSDESGNSDVKVRLRKSHEDTDVSIGDRVGVYWNGDKKYYYGKVTKHERGKKKPYFLEYDDGESEWIDFSKNAYRLVKKKKSSKFLTSKPVDDSSRSNGAKVKPKRSKSESETFLVQPSLRTKRRSNDDNALPSDPRTKRLTVDDVASPARKKRKLSDDTEASELIAKEVAKIKVGTRVAVWWPDDHKYYKGVVSRKQPEATWRPFFLEYDDGDEEWIDFRQHKFKVLSDASEEERVPSPAGKSDSVCSDPSKVWIGTRLSVWWPMEKEYFDCTVTRYRDHKRSFYLEYEDGDREWIDLSEHKFFIIGNESPKKR